MGCGSSRSVAVDNSSKVNTKKDKKVRKESSDSEEVNNEIVDIKNKNLGSPKVPDVPEHLEKKHENAETDQKYLTDVADAGRFDIHKDKEEAEANPHMGASPVIPERDQKKIDIPNMNDSPTIPKEDKKEESPRPLPQNPHLEEEKSGKIMTEELKEEVVKVLPEETRQPKVDQELHENTQPVHNEQVHEEPVGTGNVIKRADGYDSKPTEAEEPPKDIALPPIPGAEPREEQVVVDEENTSMMTPEEKENEEKKDEPTMDNLEIDKPEILKSESIQEESEKPGDKIVEDPKKNMPMPAEAKIIEKEANAIEKEANNIDKQAELIHNVVNEKEQEMFEKTKPEEDKEETVTPAPVPEIPSLQEMTPEAGDTPAAKVDEEEGSSTQSDKSPQEATYTKMKTVEYDETEDKEKENSKASEEHPEPALQA